MSLDWTGFDIDENDEIKATHIDKIHDNVDWIKDNLARITHDASFFSGNEDDYNSYKKTIHLTSEKSKEYTDNYTLHENSENSLYLISHKTEHLSSYNTNALDSKYIDYYSDRDNGADISDFIDRYSDHNKSVLTSDNNQERDGHDTSIFITHFSNNEGDHRSAESNKSYHSVVA